MLCSALNDVYILPQWCVLSRFLYDKHAYAFLSEDMFLESVMRVVHSYVQFVW